jgi:hypothetical protein
MRNALFLVPPGLPCWLNPFARLEVMGINETTPMTLRGSGLRFTTQITQIILCSEFTLSIANVCLCGETEGKFL